MPFRVRMNDVVLEAMGSLPVDELELVRAKLEEIAEMAEGFAPMSRLWTRRVDVDVVRLSVTVADRKFEFEIDRRSETVNVVAVERASGSPEDEHQLG